MKILCGSFSLASFTKQPTCCKNSFHCTCIVLIPVNVPPCVIETGQSDFHLMTLTAMRKSFKKLKPRLRSFIIGLTNTFQMKLLLGAY